MANDGRFVWYDLMTTDIPGAIAFFGEVFGWGSQATDAGDEPYTMFIAGKQPVGGVVGMPPQAKGAPPHWIGYIQVADVDATTAAAIELGGQKHHEMDIPGVGRFVILTDPQGVGFSVFAPTMEMTPRGPEPSQGETAWHELNTTDWESAWTFYSPLFGWKATESMDMGPEMGTYHMFQSPGAEGSMGGMSNAAKRMDGIPPHWLFYVNVDDLDAAIKRIEGNGGKIMNGPMDVPGGDKVAQCIDPQGGFFAIHWRNK